MNEIQLNVKGMSCQSCVRHVNHALREIDGVEQVDVRLREGKVIVQHRAPIDPAALTAAIAEAGYEASLAR